MPPKKDPNIVSIHGKDYLTVAGRVQLAHAEEQLSITTEIIPHEKATIFKATVTTKKGVFTGYAAAYGTGMIERQSPYEVAETSAVGRALGFAGFGAMESIASADEMVKAGTTEKPEPAKPSTPLEQAATPPPDVNIQELADLALRKGKLEAVLKLYKVSALIQIPPEKRAKLVERLNTYPDIVEDVDPEDIPF